MKKSRVLAFALALMMVLSVSYVPVDAAKKVNVKKITVASSLSGSTKTVVVAKGKTVKLKTVVKVTPNKKANKKVTYKSADKKIATVSKTGVIKGVKAGATTITVTSAVNKKKSAKIKVKVTAKPVSKVTLNQKSATVNLGETVQLKAKVSPAKKADKTVVWTSSNTAVATVTKTGLVSAAGVGSTVITAKSIDGSKKKASCKITVANPINLAAVTVLNAQSITFALDKPMALDASQVSVKTKWYASGNYNKTLKINGMTTNDNVNYTLVFDNDSTIGVGSYVQVAIPALTGTVKSMEVEYTEAVCAFVGEDITAWEVGVFRTKSFSFGNGNGYSNYTIDKLPAGLSAEVKDDSLRVKGVPSTAGRTDAVLTAVDELGNTLTRTIHFLV